jgi:SAM-dependent methyltransferase
MPHVQRACPVCQHTQTTLAFDNRMTPIGGLDMSYTIGRCDHCGFHYAQQLADDASFARYYQSVSKYDVASKISAIDQARIDAAIAICERQVPKGDMVVDLGCGYGALLGCMGRDGWTNLHGVDPAPNSAQRAKELFGLTSIHLGTMDSAHEVVALEQADLVCVMAVLEHLPNLRVDMQALLARLRPGCRILIEVPALDLFKAQGAEPFGEFSLEHIQFFSAASLRNFFSELGASTLAMETVELPTLRSGGLFGLFENTGSGRATGLQQREDDSVFNAYVQGSHATLHAALARVPQAPLVIYGAGSHTARLIPELEKTHAQHILAIVDGNTNLIGKPMGHWTIQSPETLADIPHAAVLVSSFRSQNEIAVNLAKRFSNAVVLMYA